jgi:hypothetical protein
MAISYLSVVDFVCGQNSAKAGEFVVQIALRTGPPFQPRHASFCPFPGTLSLYIVSPVSFLSRLSRIGGVDSKDDVFFATNPNLSSLFKHWGKSYLRLQDFPLRFFLAILR